MRHASNVCGLHHEHSTVDTTVLTVDGMQFVFGTTATLADTTAACRARPAVHSRRHPERPRLPDPVTARPHPCFLPLFPTLAFFLSSTSSARSGGHVAFATMQNDKKEVVDLYIPRKWCVSWGGA